MTAPHGRPGWRYTTVEADLVPASLERAVPSRATGAIIPAAGRGTRMRPLTHACPKELLPLGGKPVLHRLLDELAEAGIRSAVIITSREKPQLERYFHRVHPPMELRFVTQEEQNGLGDAVLCARLYAEETLDGGPALLALGDSLIESGEPISPLRRMLAQHEATGAGVILGQAVPKERVSRYGVMDPMEPDAPLRDEAFLLRRIVEKPPADLAPSLVAVAARYLLPFELFDALERTPIGPRGELDLTDALNRLVMEGAPLYGMRLRNGERRWDIGGLNTYYDAFAAYVARDRADAVATGETPS